MEALIKIGVKRLMEHEDSKKIILAQAKNSEQGNESKRKFIERTKLEKKLTYELIEKVTSLYSQHLIALADRNKDTSHINYKVHHLLYNPYTFINAYAKISKNKGALGEGILREPTGGAGGAPKGALKDEQTARFFTLGEAYDIAASFKRNDYQFKPSRRSPLRPIDTPTQRDRVVQEAIRGILEAVFEPEFQQLERTNKFRATNYGFRPGKSPFQAVEEFKTQGRHCNYVIEGDIISAYNNVDHDILLKIISTRIKDKKFLKLMKDLLKSGVIEKGRTIHSLNGSPQGGIVSPLLFNIYMFQFDKWVWNYMEENLTKKSTPIRSKRTQKLTYEMRKLKDSKTPENRKQIQERIKELATEKRKIPSYETTSLPEKPVFIRYADDWVLGLNGNKEEVEKHKEAITKFLGEELKLELDEEKTKISHLKDEGFKFIGFELIMMKSDTCRKIIQKDRNGREFRTMCRTKSRKINIRPDNDRIKANLRNKNVCHKNDMYPIGVRQWAILEEFRIVERYRSMMLGLAMYYKDVENPYILNRVSYILQYSCAKTIATRKKITMSQVFKKYGKNLRIEQEIKRPNSNSDPIIRSTSFITWSELKNSEMWKKVQSNRR